MSLTAQSILTSFEALSSNEQQELLREMLKRINFTDFIEYAAIEDADMVAAAEALFIELDEQEASCCASYNSSMRHTV